MSPLPQKENMVESGFTLIELIMVIVLLGIMGMMGAEFISLAFRGFADSDIRTEIFEEGKLALTRMEREIRNTVPNAVEQVNGAQSIQFGVINETVMATAAGVFGLYTEPPALFPIDPPTEGLTDANAAATPQTGWVVSVYNRNWTDFSGGGRLFSVTSVNGAKMTFGGQQIVEPSPIQRYYVVDKAIRYSWDNTTNVLSRAWAPVTAATGVGAYNPDIPLARDVSSFDCYYFPGSLTSNGVVSINFTISRKGTTMNFHKEVGTRNAP